ncbi:hypothetical protein [Vulcanisaeta sp. JCM 16159]|uniref:hypothetical protein n=1 Tax=Vulcanisaeta sp. JCM 16159 TaxID=1295371 RepID=UPI000A55C0AC|nr:hypothetical protein [Vulcanisaeta sp. JCM 16159]
MNDTQLISNYVNEFNNIVERLVHDNDISQYMGNSQVLVIYVDGVPRKLIMINR